MTQQKTLITSKARMAIKIENTKKKVRAQETFQWRALLTKEISLFGNSFNNKKKELWYDELSVLLKSGINLKNALELLSETQKKEQDKVLFEGMLSDLVNGISFSEIINSNSAFSNYEYYAIKIGEQTGELDRITSELGEFYKRKNQQRSEITSALTYPIIVLITALLVVGFMLKYVVPMFVDIFKQNNVELPMVTQAIVDFSELIENHGLLILLGIIITIIGVFYVSKKAWFRRVWHAFQLKLPILGDYVRKIYMAQFTQALSLLTASKVPIVHSIELVAQMIDFYPLRKGLNTVGKDVIAGEKLSGAFSKHVIFDKKMLALIRVAEETNQTEYIFDKLSEQYNHQVKNQSQVIANVLNPILTIFVGIIVGVILVAMYLPMFRLSSVIG